MGQRCWWLLSRLSFTGHASSCELRFLQQKIRILRPKERCIFVTGPDIRVYCQDPRLPIWVLKAGKQAGGNPNGTGCAPDSKGSVCNGHEGTAGCFILFFYIFIDWFCREREISICCFTHLCIHWLVLVCAPTEDRTATLAYLGDALTN